MKRRTLLKFIGGIFSTTPLSLLARSDAKASGIIDWNAGNVQLTHSSERWEPFLDGYGKRLVVTEMINLESVNGGLRKIDPALPCSYQTMVMNAQEHMKLVRHGAIKDGGSS